ncbi:MAG: hypothetical protein UR52_C0002G0093 [Candidatus Gottesmanbacteria bacterium GW2011_GWA1_34_13]|uniref:Phenylacetate-CoA ligase n=1 Tax=Candidatus Gottesmanbacteria bacterium GW2011_GWA1_34_13 TaxID=1618434 RepID=A0A0G0D975_9BACT|nr:MAG: hypothetical protein UR52_C0002G0093 [Candidatus Gottesmanbacteria bacterium GW2011_GWA1_34_13]
MHSSFKLLDSYFNTDFSKQLAVYNNENRLEQNSKKNVLYLFHQAAERIVAYKHFLKKNKIKHRKIKSLKDYARVPTTSKENYIQKYDVNLRCWDSDMSQIHMISTSSGTTGDPHFWPRTLKHEIDGAYLHEFLLNEVFKADQVSTLFINGFAMGNWIAGTFTLACVNLLAWKGYPLTIMTPGYDLEAVLELLEKVSEKFKQTIIAGHTPFLKELIDEGTKRHLDWEKLNCKFLGTGQGITEKWRSYILSLVKAKDYCRTFLNLYGSADASLMGFETPLSIDLRKLIIDNNLYQQLFNDQRIPSLYNYDPRLTFFEVEGKELLITKDSGCPLLRYNIHDEGGIINCTQLLRQIKILSQSDKISEQQLKLPFVYLYGRSKFMVKIYGANIYSEHVQLAIDDKSLQPDLTGRFILESDYDNEHNPRLICRIELASGVKSHPLRADLIKRVFISEVAKVNKEYQYVLTNMGKKVEPIIILHSHGDIKYFPIGIVKKTV